MVSYLLDTNVVSERYKGQRCDRHVAAWFEAAGEGQLFTSVLVLGEIRSGVEKVRGRDLARAAALELWLTGMSALFAERILTIDAATADTWGRMNAARTVPLVDALLAATALAHGLTLVTRNEADVRGLGVEVLNPFKPAQP